MEAVAAETVGTDCTLAPQENKSNQSDTTSGSVLNERNAMSIQSIVRGNLTRDPEAREIKVGGELRRVVDIRIFSDEYRREGDQLVQDDERCVGVDVTIWVERLGEQVLTHLRKGSRVEATGPMHLHRYKDRETGESRAGLQMNADSVTLVLSRIESIAFTPSRRSQDADEAAMAGS
jgi:single-stranded DNA-binding protein